ncbi:uncharacterized protein VTP21DRAFT_401 [Calcarisporiella thermophila]|uniref:uncharacterized protein n=1 Tax=Calcarisporiella thermophila TaxID=911321 RepID=UPI0037448831
MSTQTGPAPTFECSLHGLIDDTLLPNLLERLKSLCGLSNEEDVYEHEIVFVPAVETPIGPARSEDIVLRLRSSVVNENLNDLNIREWQLCQFGPPEPRLTGKTVTVRQVTTVKINGKVFDFLSLLGYRMSFEISRKGYCFVFNDILRITVTQLFRLDQKHDLLSARPLGGENLWLVEVNSILIIQEAVVRMAEQFKSFKMMMTGLVDLEYVDHRALENRIQYTS